MDAGEKNANAGTRLRREHFLPSLSRADKIKVEKLKLLLPLRLVRPKECAWNVWTRPFRWRSRNVRVGQVLPILAASARTVVIQ